MLSGASLLDFFTQWKPKPGGFLTSLASHTQPTPAWITFRIRHGRKGQVILGLVPRSSITANAVEGRVKLLRR